MMDKSCHLDVLCMMPSPLVPKQNEPTGGQNGMASVIGRAVAYVKYLFRLGKIQLSFAARALP